LLSDVRESGLQICDIDRLNDGHNVIKSISLCVFYNDGIDSIRERRTPNWREEV
jgi:hypothetical protein